MKKISRKSRNTLIIGNLVAILIFDVVITSLKHENILGFMFSLVTMVFWSIVGWFFIYLVFYIIELTKGKIVYATESKKIRTILIIIVFITNLSFALLFDGSFDGLWGIARATAFIKMFFLSTGGGMIIYFASYIKRANLFVLVSVTIFWIYISYRICLKDAYPTPMTKEEKLLIEQEDAEASNKTRIMNYAFSKKLVGEKEYNEVVDNATDTLKNWVANDLPSYRSVANSPYQIDTLFCFNKEKSKCISCVISKGNEVGGANLLYFYGVKIKGKWYFFGGPTVVLPRDYYYPETFPKPFSFDELHNIAGREIYENYLTRREDSKTYEINDVFFSDITSNAYCSKCKTNQDYDRFFLDFIRENWISKYKPLKEEEIIYNYDKTKKTLQVTFPIHYPTFSDIEILSMQVDYWKSLPAKQEAERLEGDDNGYYSGPFYVRYEYIKKGNIKIYSKLLPGIEPNTTYTIRIRFGYNKGDYPVYVTRFKAK